ncbi:uncharacterized protein IWZ02DRAFT_290446 [Phyllosticta citriasiana]|uniref:uncharacterized protein n=1 Tax=Phyllosticta citriasiana TaxID=595635 RepID=UPI0030FD82A6
MHACNFFYFFFFCFPLFSLLPLFTTVAAAASIDAFSTTTTTTIHNSNSNSTNPSTRSPHTADPTWHPSPKTRGTYQLLLGCLTTLSLCAWTAYHPNVRPHRGTACALWRRFTWILAAVVAPEVVLYHAWEQRWTASLLRKRVNWLGGGVGEGFGRVRARARAMGRERGMQMEVSVFALCGSELEICDLVGEAKQPKDRRCVRDEEQRIRSV